MPRSACGRTNTRDELRCDQSYPREDWITKKGSRTAVVGDGIHETTQLSKVVIEISSVHGSSTQGLAEPAVREQALNALGEVGLSAFRIASPNATLEVLVS